MRKKKSWIDEPMDEYLSRFVLNTDGERIGETVGIDGERIIMKREEDFFSIPKDAIEEKYGDLLLSKPIDWEESKALGEQWREKSYNKIEYDEEGKPIL